MAGGRLCGVFVEGICRRISFLFLQLDAPVGRNTLLIVQMEICSCSTGFFLFVPGKESRISYILLLGTCKGVPNYMVVISFFLGKWYQVHDI